MKYARLIWWTGLLGLLILLSACGAEATPTAVPPTSTTAPVPPTATVPAPTATTAPAAPTATATLPPAAPTDTPVPPAANTVAATPTEPKPTQLPETIVPAGGLGHIVAGPPGSTFVIPTAEPTLVPTVVAMPKIIGPDGVHEDEMAELNAYFALFYKARTLTPGGRFDFATVTNLTASPYRDYTIPLLQKNQDDADAGKLKQVSYSDIQVINANGRGPGPDGLPWFDVTIKRTQTQVRTDSKPAPETLTLNFRLKYIDLGDKFAYQAYDYLNLATDAWLSDTLAQQIPAAQVQRELNDFFAQFYAARTLAPDHDFDLETTQGLTAGAYQDYTLPLLAGQEADAQAGKITAVSYTGISVKLLKWDPLASNHGGLATVAVTRTSHTQRPGQPEDVQTATYQFRIHRHINDDGSPLWLALDFLSPITNQWVSESAGMSGPIPPDGHG